MDESTNSGDKRLSLVVRAYLVTMGVTVLITLLAIIFLVDTSRCSSLGRALVALAGTTAAVFLASLVVVGVRAWKTIPGVSDRVAIVVVYGMLLLVSHFVFTCGLMVLFNC
jgi:hypothetical protein